MDLNKNWLQNGLDLLYFSARTLAASMDSASRCPHKRPRYIPGNSDGPRKEGATHEAAGQQHLVLCAVSTAATVTEKLFLFKEQNAKKFRKKARWWCCSSPGDEPGPLKTSNAEYVDCRPTSGSNKSLNTPSRSYRNVKDRP